MSTLDGLEKSLQHEIATKVILNLPEEQKQAIIASGITKLLREDLRLDYEIEKLLKNEAIVFAGEYIKQPEVQDVLRKEAQTAVDKIIDGIWKAIAQGIEASIKNKYKTLFS